ncbi:hypothetical protein OZX67_09310 [Bifidobacterium sp. ESL0728]|uniref:hypothetical protein n=1 Tax=Bifidobacterium sp. ESL0728 TaxID=2983220 RepID=UPI0023F92299|nr:hypothetical protein [Bifidobacterium sp. ESL0728]WEV58964.1 hypothetical protein OZX67_09310 [Bifidobacterium sp. ESL0728]
MPSGTDRPSDLDDDGNDRDHSHHSGMVGSVIAAVIIIVACVFVPMGLLAMPLSTLNGLLGLSL